MITVKKSLIVFYTEDKKILLQDRNFKEWNEWMWWFFWWTIERWETPEEAVVRETKEELTYDLKEYKYIWNHKNYVPYRNAEVEVFIFIAPLKNINDFEQREWDRMIVVSIDEARKLNMRKEIAYDVLDIVEKELNI